MGTKGASGGNFKKLTMSVSLMLTASCSIQPDSDDSGFFEMCLIRACPPLPDSGVRRGG